MVRIPSGDRAPITCNSDTPGALRTYKLSGSSLTYQSDHDVTFNFAPPLNVTPQLFLDDVQGAVFTKHGRLILVRSGFNAVFCFSALNGYCHGMRQLGDYGHGASEVESVTLRSWHFGDVTAQVHISELDNDWPDRDDFYVHSYQVPDPARL